jgi:hypothetical protein
MDAFHLRKDIKLGYLQFYDDKSQDTCSCLQMWSSLISKAKAGGIDVIQTYVFWNLHEPQQGQVAPCACVRPLLIFV